MLSLAVDPLPATPSGTALRGTAVLTTTASIAPEQYFATVTVLQNGVVVSRPPVGTDAGPVLALTPGESIVVPLSQDLAADCGTALPTPAATAAAGGSLLTPAAPDGAVEAASDEAEVRAADAAAPDTAGGVGGGDGGGVGGSGGDGGGDGVGTPGTGSATPAPSIGDLPPGEYVVVVAVHVVRDGGLVVAATAPLTIT
ncbi:hypothetical protein FH969_06845 [Miniimonas arenae]|uniref:Uncharacterized protein n=1 Tax=Miniimonas arenae TaxID=676201 RepID=A0A5C5BDJ6_9MICO|nr:hypothetical protein FH969_06845 [Miniimonas arenae]